MTCLSADVMTLHLEMLISMPHLLTTGLSSSVASCTFSIMVDISVVLCAYLISMLRLVTSLSCLHKLFMSALKNSNNKLNRTGENKQLCLTLVSPLNHCVSSPLMTTAQSTLSYLASISVVVLGFIRIEPSISTMHLSKCCQKKP